MGAGGMLPDGVLWSVGIFRVVVVGWGGASQRLLNACWGRRHLIGLESAGC